MNQNFVRTQTMNSLQTIRSMAKLIVDRWSLYHFYIPLLTHGFISCRLCIRLKSQDDLGKEIVANMIGRFILYKMNWLQWYWYYLIVQSDSIREILHLLAENPDIGVSFTNHMEENDEELLIHSDSTKMMDVLVEETSESTSTTVVTRSSPRQESLLRTFLPQEIFTVNKEETYLYFNQTTNTTTTSQNYQMCGNYSKITSSWYLM